MASAAVSPSSPGPLQFAAPTMALAVHNRNQGHYGRPGGVTRAEKTTAWLRDYLTAIKHGRWHPFTPLERRVREATRNEPWGPTGMLLNELADASFNYADCRIIFAVVEFRLGYPAAKWRNVYKALTVLEFLLKRGSEMCVTTAQDDLMFRLEDLSQRFDYIGPDGKDHGINVRHRAGAILALVTDEARLAAERKQFEAKRHAYGGFARTDAAANAGLANGFHPPAGFFHEDAKSPNAADDRTPDKRPPPPAAAGETKGVTLEENRRHLAALREMLQDPANKLCADCGMGRSSWASINCGVFVCLVCAGVHRGLGVHVSKVRSCSLDTWLPEQVAFMGATGNAVARRYWESRMAPSERPRSNGDTAALEAFIRRKYEARSWARGEWPPEEALPKPEPEGPSEEELAAEAAAREAEEAAREAEAARFREVQRQLEEEAAAAAAAAYRPPPPNLMDIDAEWDADPLAYAGATVVRHTSDGAAQSDPPAATGTAAAGSALDAERASTSGETAARAAAGGTAAATAAAATGGEPHPPPQAAAAAARKQQHSDSGAHASKSGGAQATDHEWAADAIRRHQQQGKQPRQDGVLPPPPASLTPQRPAAAGAPAPAAQPPTTQQQPQQQPADASRQRQQQQQPVGASQRQQQAPQRQPRLSVPSVMDAPPPRRPRPSGPVRDPFPSAGGSAATPSTSVQQAAGQAAGSGGRRQQPDAGAVAAARSAMAYQQEDLGSGGGGASSASSFRRPASSPLSVAQAALDRLARARAVATEPILPPASSGAPFAPRYPAAHPQPAASTAAASQQPSPQPAAFPGSQQQPAQSAAATAAASRQPSLQPAAASGLHQQPAALQPATDADQASLSSEPAAASADADAPRQQRQQQQQQQPQVYTSRFSTQRPRKPYNPLGAQDGGEAAERRGQRGGAAAAASNASRSEHPRVYVVTRPITPAPSGEPQQQHSHQSSAWQPQTQQQRRAQPSQAQQSQQPQRADEWQQRKRQMAGYGELPPQPSGIDAIGSGGLGFRAPVPPRVSPLEAFRQQMAVAAANGLSRASAPILHRTTPIKAIKAGATVSVHSDATGRLQPQGQRT